METHAEHLLQTALSLPVTDRAEIAASLFASLDDAADSDVNSAWAAEVCQRLDSIDRGEVELVPWDDVTRSMRERLHGHTTG
jgi:putative addiction module component (TIGR02574 family)